MRGIKIPLLKKRFEEIYSFDKDSELIKFTNVDARFYILPLLRKKFVPGVGNFRLFGYTWLVWNWAIPK